MPELFGLIGYPLSHSFSPAYFKKKFTDRHIDAQYDLYPLASIKEFPALILSCPDLAGLSVTIPYKTSVIPYLDDIDPLAAEINAVNCIVCTEGRTKGFNTDVTGFRLSIIPLLQPHHTHALILGTGGASLAVAYTLKELGITFQKVSRTKTVDTLVYEDITPDIIAEHKLIINTTPLGMYPNPLNSPSIPYQYLSKDHLLYDVIYNPELTQFLLFGQQHGANTKNGFEMLQLQADASWDIWKNTKI